MFNLNTNNSYFLMRNQEFNNQIYPNPPISFDATTVFILKMAMMGIG